MHLTREAHHSLFGITIDSLTQFLAGLEERRLFGRDAHHGAAFRVAGFTGVALASVYMLRSYIRTLRTRAGEAVESRELRFGDALVLVPLTLAILAFAVYPQAALTASEPAVKAANRQVAR